LLAAVVAVLADTIRHIGLVTVWLTSAVLVVIAMPLLCRCSVSCYMCSCGLLHADAAMLMNTVGVDVDRVFFCCCSCAHSHLQVSHLPLRRCGCSSCGSCAVRPYLSGAGSLSLVCFIYFVGINGCCVCVVSRLVARGDQAVCLWRRHASNSRDGGLATIVVIVTFDSCLQRWQLMP